MPPPDQEPQPIPGYRNYLVYCDESGHAGKVYYGFGSLWMPLERRGDFTGLIRTLRDRHRYRHEIKWDKIEDQNEAFYRDLIEEFFRRKWLMFHCLIGRRSSIDSGLHGGGYDEALRKHSALLVRNKIAFFSQGDRRKAYHIVIDKPPSLYETADEAAHIILNDELKQRMGFTPVHTLVTRRPKDVAGIQAIDVLLGAVVADWNQDSSGPAKKGVRDWVAEHLGWRHLRAGTRQSEWKFNIWYFHGDGKAKAREPRSWALNLKYPVPPHKSGRVKGSGIG